ncbi:MAG TPA: PD-(D/E)XK nuclease family protein [Steroidobacteraceae bacterium]
MSPNARCIAHLASGGWLLTPDLRQSRIFRRLHDRAQIAAGRVVWPSAQVMPFDGWLALQWRDAGAARDDLPQPLPAVALRWLWRRQAARDTPGLLDPADLGARARASWLRLRSHGGGIEDVARFPLTRDQQAFAAWARGAEDELRSRGACDPADLARLFVTADALPPPGPPLLLAGFRRLAPSQSALLAVLKARGWSVNRVEPSDAGNVPWRHAAPDPESERAAMLDWMRERLARQPDGLHAMVVPDLASHRGAIERALEAALQPELELPGVGRRDRVFDLAGGGPLSAHPVAESALDALATALGQLDGIMTSRLLRSPFLAGAQTEHDARIRLDLELRGAQGLSQAPVAAFAARAAASEARQFAAILSGAIAALTGPRRRKAVAWAETFGACLAAWGWPGETVLDSHTFQAAKHFRESLGELAALAVVAPELGASQSLDELRRLAAAPFQPESGEPSVFVLDAYEDPGLRFDSLWIAGLTAAAWPRPVAIDPLLPIEIQRRLGMPCATAADSVDEARSIIGSWRAQADVLVLSWPRRENDTDVDGTPLLPTDAGPLARLTPRATRERLVHAAAVLEPLPDDRAPPLKAAAAHGGARVLELQSQCPFRAFAQLRLRAEPLEELRAGVDRRLRGIVLHRALQRFWTDLGAQQALLRLDAAACEAKVAAAIDQSLAEVLPAASGRRTTALERDWQLRAIGHLLELERIRPPFTVVETERELDGKIGGLELRLRVDRVDRVGDELVVIDYKSGAVRKAPWRGARMEAPQLPLYAVLHPGRPAAIAIAELDAEGAKFTGVGRSEGLIATLEPAPQFELTEDRESGFEWSVIQEHWYAWLDRLARDHAAGHAEVDPKLAADTCRYCHLDALCRVAALDPDEAGAGEGGDDA